MLHKGADELVRDSCLCQSVGLGLRAPSAVVPASLKVGTRHGVSPIRMRPLVVALNLEGARQMSQGDS